MKNINIGKLFTITNIKLITFFAYVLVFYMFGADAEKVRYSEIILIAFIGLELLDILKNKKIKYSIPIVIIFLFAFYCFLSNFWAINAVLAINRAKTLFVLSIFLLISYNFFINVDDGEKKLLCIIMYAGIIFSIYVIMYYGIGEYFSKLINGERVGEEINNVNAIGLQTAISVVIAIFYGLYENKKRYFILAIIPLIVSLGTGSRKVIILIVLGAILLFILKREEKISVIKTFKKVAIFAIIVACFVFIAQLPMFSTVFDRFERTINSVTGKGRVDNSTEERSLFVRAGLEQFLEKPILGIGIANSNYITMEVANWSSYLHNNFVELLSTTGIIGFILYYSMHLYIIINCIKMLKFKDKYINIVLIIFLINLVLDYAMVSYYSKTTYVYFLLGLITVEKRKRAINEENNQLFKTTEKDNNIFNE